MSSNSSNVDPVDAILQSDRASQQLREQEAAELERQRRRVDELRAAFEAVRRCTAVVFDSMGYQKAELADQEFCAKWADLWLALGDQLRDKQELLAQQPEALCGEPGDAPRTVALAVLTAALQRDRTKVINLFQQLTTASAELQVPVNEWLRYRLERLILGDWVVGDGDQSEGQDSRVSGQPEGTGADSGQEKAGQRERADKKKHRRGKLPLEQAHPLQFQVYQRIEREHLPGHNYKDIVDRLKNDRDFADQVRAAGLKLNTKLVRKALGLFDQRQREARKKISGSGQDSRN
jgi:hypothetical protein